MSECGSIIGSMGSNSTLRPPDHPVNETWRTAADPHRRRHARPLRHILILGWTKGMERDRK